MSLSRQASAGYLVNHMARLFANALADRLAPMGLATAQFAMLLELWTVDGLTQRQLVERLDLEQATVANTLARMERDGLIQREPHPEDGRAQIVRLTRKARALEAAATAEAEAINAAALAGLSDVERRQALKLFHKIIENLRRA